MLDVQSDKSYEALRSNAKFRFFVYDGLPDVDRVRNYSSLHSQEIKGVIMRDDDFWKDLLDSRRNVKDFTLNEEFFAEVSAKLVEGEPVIVGVNIIPIEWGRQQEIKERMIFNKDGVDPSSLGKWRSLPVGLIASRLGIPGPLQNFQLQKETEGVEKTTDALGLEIDDNILELVRYLNALGISTTGSCGGHNERRLPYLVFDGASLDGVVKFALLIKSITGNEWYLASDRFLKGVFLEPSSHATLAECQKDLDRVTDYLAGKSKMYFRLTSKEWINKLRRKLRNLLCSV